MNFKSDFTLAELITAMINGESCRRSLTNADEPVILPFIQLMLRIRLYRSIYLKRDIVLEPLVSMRSNERRVDVERFLWKELSLKRVRSLTQISYLTAIAHKLARLLELSATDIAAQIIDAVSRDTLNQQKHQLKFLDYPDFPGLKDIALRVTESGLIQLDLGHQAIAEWLNLLLHRLPTLNQQKDDTGKWIFGNLDKASSPIHPSALEFSPHKIFILQHTYARSCSLLRLAHQEGLISLNQIDEPACWQIVVPSSIPWLTTEGKFWLHNSDELRLISQIFAVMDELPLLISSRPSNKRVLCLAEETSQAFQAFYTACPIWGSVRESAELARARLGLVMVTQLVFRLLIEGLLGIYAPLNL